MSEARSHGDSVDSAVAATQPDELTDDELEFVVGGLARWPVFGESDSDREQRFEGQDVAWP